MKISKSVINNNLSILSYNRFFTGIGYYLFVPLLSIILLGLKIDTRIVSVLLALFSFATKGGGIVSLVFPKWFIHEKIMISIGTLFAAMGLWLTVILHKSEPMIYLTIFVAGLGISVNLLGIQTYISNHVLGNNKRFSNYTLQIWIANLTAVIGPIIAGHLMKVDSTIPLLASGICYFGAFLNTQLFFKPTINSVVFSQTNIIHILNEIAFNKKFRLLLVTSFSMWFVYGQLYFIFPIYVKFNLGSGDNLGYLFGLNSLVLVLFQGIVHRMLDLISITDSFSKIVMTIGWGFAFIGVGFFCVLISAKIRIFIWVGVILLSLGELLNMPLLDFAISKVTGILNSAQFFSVYTVVCGVGYGLSSLIFGHFTNYIHLELIILT